MKIRQLVQFAIISFLTLMFIGICIVLLPDFLIQMEEGGAIRMFLEDINWLGLGILGLIIVVIGGVINQLFDSGCFIGMGSIVLLFLCGVLCNQIGLLSIFWNWLF